VILVDRDSSIKVNNSLIRNNRTLRNNREVMKDMNNIDITR